MQGKIVLVYSRKVAMGERPSKASKGLESASGPVPPKPDATKLVKAMAESERFHRSPFFPLGENGRPREIIYAFG